MTEFLISYLEFILNFLMNRVEAFTHWWMWVFLFIPALVNLIYTVIGVTLLTAPVWLPIRMMFNKAPLISFSVKSNEKAGIVRSPK